MFFVLVSRRFKRKKGETAPEQYIDSNGPQEVR